MAKIFREKLFTVLYVQWICFGTGTSIMCEDFRNGEPICHRQFRFLSKLSNLIYYDRGF